MHGRKHARTFFLLFNKKAPKSTTKQNISWPIDKAKHVVNFCLENKTAASLLRLLKTFAVKIEFQLISIGENKTGMDRFQDCCKAKATNALLHI